MRTGSLGEEQCPGCSSQCQSTDPVVGTDPEEKADDAHTKGSVISADGGEPSPTRGKQGAAGLVLGASLGREPEA